jgi:hypothetical protein
LCLKQMQVDNNPFPVNAIDLQGAKILIQLKHVESTKGKNVVINEERCKSLDDKIWSSKVVLEKEVDGKETLKITLKASKLGGKPTARRQIEVLFSRIHRIDRSDR